MASNPPLVFHEYKHQYPTRNNNDRHERHRRPPIPDLRFEISYLRSIQPYIHFRSLKPAQKPEGKGERKVKQGSGKTEPANIEWGHVLWITLRDQVMSPLFQGALWALVSFYLTPYSARLAHTLSSPLSQMRKLAS
ncbi:hypothetical protein BDP27DRAFT_1254657 [Rhodocollybia butyracea]|uniref:Uncharacterized protein n=1 Tax=Rhodocollybia butyracea TaxID=206335 RepID=A0A9P5Q8V3_9AGAR|nr:hypothetical protein BDP27DRAFT_1254657 [Rhodocollybia butyracea]